MRAEELRQGGSTANVTIVSLSRRMVSFVAKARPENAKSNSMTNKICANRKSPVITRDAISGRREDRFSSSLRYSSMRRLPASPRLQTRRGSASTVSTEADSTIPTERSAIHIDAESCAAEFLQPRSASLQPSITRAYVCVAASRECACQSRRIWRCRSQAE